ncbi:hypothetical protein [Loktanella sp. M215]|uniref:restriction endonuclease subunit S n=1 Tax=Loktanella sp. M215 TaxID=2675431 RepID=UPI001F40440E|nr:hypothetical protein [Loktanella sp. M215]MCF7699954.1 restriction endonuclease subunit S [Loktanella sp. M215]
MMTLQQRVHSAKRPEGWTLDKLHRTLNVRRGNKNSGMVDNNLLSLSYGRIIPKDINADGGLLPESFETYQVIEAGDIVMRLTDLQNDKRSLRQGLATERGIITSAYDALHVARDNDPKFWFYSLLALDLAKYYYSIGGGVRQSVKFSDFPNEWIYRPDLPTQKRIAAFLDCETSRIDELILKKERLVSLLQERGDAAREELLWGQGPSTKLGHHISILPGYAFASTNFSENPNDIRLLRGANVGANEVRWDDVVYWPKADIAGLQRFELNAGDIVMGMDRPWISGGIRVAEITEDDLPCLLLQRVCKIAPRSTLSVRFLKAIIESRKFIAYFEPILTGVSVPHISSDQIANFRFPFIDKDEQERRMTKLERITRSIFPITQATQTSIDRLREYRSALIAAAVTGQIDVDTYGKADATATILDQIEDEMHA